MRLYLTKKKNERANRNDVLNTKLYLQNWRNYSFFELCLNCYNVCSLNHNTHAISLSGMAFYLGKEQKAQKSIDISQQGNKA